MDRKFLIGLVVAIGLILRVISLDQYPVGFTPDEASHGYDAYSLLQTGKDQWNKSWPLVFESFGDFKLPLYTYLTIPSIAIFGLNEFAVRLPNALLGSLAILFTYLFTREFLKNEKLALVSAIFLSLSPWHIPLSRGAFEANVTTLLLPLGFWLFLKAKGRPLLLVISAGVIGLNLFSYHSARLITPLLFAALLFLKYKEYKPQIHVPVVTFGLILAITAFTMLSGSATRGSDIVIFNPTDNWSAVSDQRYEGVLVGESDSLARLFSNKLTYTLDQFTKNYISYFSFQFLFTQGAGEWTYGMIPGQGILYMVEMLFVFVVIWKLIKKGETPLFWFVILWLVISPIPAAITKGPGYAANRAAVMMPALQIISAYGAITLYELLKKRKNLQVLIAGIYLLGVVIFLEKYIYHSPSQAAPSMLYGRQEAIDKVSKIENEYQKIIVSRSLSEPHIYVAFYNKLDPRIVQEASKNWNYREHGRSFVDQLGEYHLGKYTFSDINFGSNSQLPGVLLVGKPDEFPQNIPTIGKINFPNGKPAIYIVDPRKATYGNAN